ncbi:Uncharacterised protein [Mycobacteroides abscessus subsp. abscessus]|nr:Uncharacterised protein [Mycobacteroides abscessus subsp. abscessus]
MFDEGGDQTNRAEHIRGDDLLGGLQKRLGVMPVFDAHDPGHGDKDVEGRVVGKYLLGGDVDARRVGNVDAHGRNPRVIPADLIQ